MGLVDFETWKDFSVKRRPILQLIDNCTSCTIPLPCNYRRCHPKKGYTSEIVGHWSFFGEKTLIPNHTRSATTPRLPATCIALHPTTTPTTHAWPSVPTRKYPIPTRRVPHLNWLYPNYTLLLIEKERKTDTNNRQKKKERRIQKDTKIYKSKKDMKRNKIEGKKETSNDIIAGTVRERFMIEFKFIDKFLKVLINF